MVRPAGARTAQTLDLKKLADVKGEAKVDSKAAEDQRPPEDQRQGAEGTPKQKYDYRKYALQQAPIRIHKKKLEAFRRESKSRLMGVSSLMNQALDIGAKALGIEYDDGDEP